MGPLIPVRAPRRGLRPLLLAVLLAAGPTATRAATACPEHFRGGREPVLTNPKLADRARPLCFAGFALLHSGRARTPLYAAEHLTRERVERAREVDRLSEFHEEAGLPPAERAELADYARSGFDRGHMAPSGDMPDLAAQGESFTLANVVPQNPTDNRELWADVESAVRALAVEEGEVYVVTGPIYEGADLSSLRDRVLVPTHLFKAVYLPGRDGVGPYPAWRAGPGRGPAGVYVARNAAAREWRVVPVAELERLAGVDVFPGLSEEARATAASLPEPHDAEGSRGAGPRQPRTGRRERPRGGAEAGSEDWFDAALRRALRDLWRAVLRAIF